MHDAVNIEKLGKPTLTIVTTNFISLANHMAKTLGMPGLPIAVVPHPLGGIADEEVKKKAGLTIEEIIDKATALTLYKEEEKKEKKDFVIVKGTIHEVILEYYNSGWTDGLPIIPPTEEAVQEMLKGTDLLPDRLLGVMAPESGKVTIEKIAINAVMAGCRPTYMPVLVAAVEGLLEKDFDLPGVQTSTGAHSPLLMINGPIRQQIKINYSSGALGPGWQANASIGRAIRFILNNIGGAKIGSTDMTTLGMAENFTYCLGENEEENPWIPFHVEQGFKKEDSTVSVIGAYSPEHVSDHVGVEPQEILTVAADVISRITRFHLPVMDHIITHDYILILCPEHAESIARAGWTKKDVQKFLYDHSQIPYRKLKLLRREIDPSKLVGSSSPEGPMVPMFLSPEKIKIIVAGGPGKHSTYINVGHTRRIFTKKIAFPKDWEKLVERYKES